MRVNLGRFLLLVLVLLSVGVKHSSATVATSVDLSPLHVFTSFPQLNLKLEPFATGLSQPVGLVSPGIPGNNRMIVIEQEGLIKVLDEHGNVKVQPFLDLTDRVTYGGEMGLLGIVFHPDYESNGYFYVNYISGDDTEQHTRISRFQVTADPDTADPNSENILLTANQPYSIHNAGAIHFGPDGYLYIPLGDGGFNGNAQNMNTVLGKVLRIDVDQGVGVLPDCATDGSGDYTIPGTNPFVDGSGGACDEIWASGLRNPWRSSFDRETGDFYIADVGQDSQEEINMQPGSSSGGENYGWPCYEGTMIFLTAPICGPFEDYDSPIFTYDHSDNICAVAGGYVYHGFHYPVMEGHYLLADACSGDFWDLVSDGKGGWDSHQFPGLGPQNFSTAFGEDLNGEQYLIALNGTIFRIQEDSDHLYISLPFISSPDTVE